MPSPNFTTFDFISQFNTTNSTLNLSDATTYIGGGAANAIGIDFTVWYGAVNTGMIVYQNTSWVTPDIVPSNPVTLVVQLPQFNSQIQWGQYNIVGTLKDQDGTLYTTSKAFNLCKPDGCDCGCGGTKTNLSCATLSVAFDCVQSVVFVQDTTLFVYQKVTGSPSYSMAVTNAANQVTNYTIPSFIISPVVAGNYNFIISDTATYDMGNNIFVIVGYAATINKESCGIDICKMLCAYDIYFNNYVKSSGQGGTMELSMQINLIELSSLATQILFGQQCGSDVSKQIKKFQSIVKADCSCSCGTAIPPSGIFTTSQIDVLPDPSGAGDIAIRVVTVGNTTNFYVKDNHYVIQPAAGQTGITINSVVSGQTITYNLSICADELQICNSTQIAAVGSNFVYQPVSFASGTQQAALTAQLSQTETDIITRVNAIISQVNSLQSIPTWTNISLGTGWSNNSGNSQYCINAWNFVNLRGLIQKTNPSSGDVCGTLPAGFRPVQSATFNVLLFDGFTQGLGQVTVLTNGNITLENTSLPSGTYVIGLDGLSFSTHS